MNIPKMQREKQLSNSDLRGTVKVFCRLRPLADEAEFPSIKLLSPTTLTVISDPKGKGIRKECNYVFRHVFTSYSGQREVFEHVALPLLEDVVNGKNGLLFTYGVTGSGKTYTLNGDQANPGIMPSCINTLFNSISHLQAYKFLIKSDRMNGFEVQSENEALEERLRETKMGTKHVRSVRKGDRITYTNDETKLKSVPDDCSFSVFVSYTEIYNNQVYDLLDESNGKVLQSKIIREDSQRNMYVNGVEEVEVKSAADAFELFALGQKRKRMAHTLLNAESSRSHSIFNIRVVQLVHSHDVVPAQSLMRVGQLSLVDLAGSERCNRTNNTGMRLKEASSINNSLMTLRSCMEALRENQTSGGNRVVPYRDSRLTLLFKNYFEGEGQVQMIVCIKPSEQDNEENLQVLKFAEVTQDIQITKAEPRYLQFRTPTNKIGYTPTPKTVKAKSASSLPVVSKLPSIRLDLDDCNDNIAIFEKLARAVRVRKQRQGQFRDECDRSATHLRKRLVEINQENILSKSEIRNLKAIIKKDRSQMQNQNVKIADLELANHEFLQKNNEQQELIQGLQLTIDEKNLKINQNCLEHEKNKQKFVIQTEKLNQELDNKLRKQREQLEVEMHARDLKLKKVKEVIDSELNVEVTPTRIETIRQLDTETKENIPQYTTTPALERTVTIGRVNRARGVGDIWLEHNAVKPIALQTVLQPSMKRRKSVDRLKKATDVTNPKQSKYCLIAQESDGAGDIETRLYKGDIVPTCTGGAQVIFNGVERLREESPTRTPLSPNNK
ncbi:hypothetical protein PPYR_13727 [Photinus pyralis]|uniref:Kinesin-like protein n=1 Tax=Photinus pyralis TaxID=7054 RepID=A0A1Y1M7S9_PHOPY|nr:kinesin-like protein KIF23 [Photinus pyralis]KAB0794107.1 hypothetical protein PPYR_13727 [Photinus pyralis]